MSSIYSIELDQMKTKEVNGFFFIKNKIFALYHAKKLSPLQENTQWFWLHT